ncbi:MAG: chemotaxis protein CheX [Oscillospiraceae bacterium]|nr:chemotaxis protein CheX [Oscillospiraceae bacterium]
MFTQLFGHYLLNKNYINAEQLQKALEAKNETRVKLGALAIDAGYMTAGQVEKVHEEQKRLDKRIGDIAVSMGFLTEAQVDELLSKQKTANIVIGQTLMDLGFMTNADFEKALAEYKASAGFTGDDNSDESLAENIASVFALDDMSDKDFYVDYLLLFIRNIVRFVGDDFAFAGCVKNPETKNEYLCSQDISGAVNAYTAIGGDKAAFYALATRYAGEEVDDDEFAEACAGEFLNLQNGLYAVNVSNTQNTELDLTPQVSEKDVTLNMDNGIQVSLAFSFGTLNVIICKN